MRTARHASARLAAPALAALLATAALAGCGSSGSPAGGSATVASTAGATVAGPAAVPPLTGTPTLVTPAAAAALVGQATPPVVVDVRTPAEFATGHLAGATNLDVKGSSFATQLAALDRSATYLVYCHSGNRSAMATAAMAKLGFTNVYEMQGGITAWQAAGYPVTA